MKTLKYFTLTIATAFAVICVEAQTPVTWKFESKKTDDKTYEIHITATIAEPWKIYSQETPEGGPIPTTFNTTKNPLIDIVNNFVEIGEMKKMHEDVFGVDVFYYKNKVEFVQRVKLKSKSKTKVNGQLQYMACNDQQCLPPATVPFSIALN